MTTNLKESPFSSEAIQTYSKIIEVDRKLNVHPWTKDLLSHLQVSFIFHPIATESWMSGIKENDILKIMFARAIVTEYLKVRDFLQAELIATGFENRSDILCIPKNLEDLSDLISKWKQSSEVLPKDKE